MIAFRAESCLMNMFLIPNKPSPLLLLIDFVLPHFISPFPSFLYLSIFVSITVSVYLASISLSHSSVCLSLCLFVCLSVSQSRVLSNLISFVRVQSRNASEDLSRAIFFFRNLQKCDPQKKIVEGSCVLPNHVRFFEIISKLLKFEMKLFRKKH